MTPFRRRGGPRGPRGLRVLAWIVAVLLVLIVAGIAGAGWYYSDQIDQDLLTPSDDPPEYDVRVIGVSGDRVVLERTEDSTLPGTYGLEWADGYARIEEVVETGPRTVERAFVPVGGSLRAGDRVRIRSWTFAGDPQEAVGLGFEDVAYASDLGRFPAWLLDGSDPTWVIFVHGRGATREEALRILPTVVDLGHPSLVITYRNDPEAPPSRDGRYHFGESETEWRDVEGAVRFALDGGAEDVVLFGYSMGGAIVTTFLSRSGLADRVRGVILDAPLLDVAAAVEQEGANRGLPRFLPSLGMVLASLRFGTDWERLDRSDEAARLDLPMLLIHGTADDTTPIALSDALAASAAESVTYERFRGAGHVRSWNVDPAGYEMAVRGFLTEVAP